VGKTSIEWTDMTWNCVRGCTRVSEGCRFCYAERQAARFAGHDLIEIEANSEINRGGHGPFAGFAKMTAAGPRWTGRVELIPHMLALPLQWKRPRRIFVNSMSDLFHEALPFEQIAAVFGVMATCPQHIFQVLTKRPERAREFIESVSRVARAPMSNGREVTVILGRADEFLPDDLSDKLWTRAWSNAKDAWPLPNVWLGTSCENQETADRRIPELLRTPAAIRFVSCEPMLAHVDFTAYLGRRNRPVDRLNDSLGENLAPHLDQVIVGGESGPHARPFDLAWPRSVIGQCKAAKVACFIKQLGAQPIDGYLTACEVVEGERGIQRPTDQPLTEEVAAAILRDHHLVDIPAGGFPRRLALKDRKGGDMSEWPEYLRVREFPEAPR